MALVALFDTPTPGYPKIARHWRRYVGYLLSRDFWTLRGVADAIGHGRHLLKATPSDLPSPTELPLADTPPTPPVAPIEPHVANEAAARSYVPAEYSGRICLFLAADENHSTRILEDSRTGWQDFARGGCDIVTIPGKHDTIFIEPNVEKLSAHLTELLQAFSSDPDPSGQASQPRD